MTKKKTYKVKVKQPEANEPEVAYTSRSIHIFKSFEEQENCELQQMAAIKIVRSFYYYKSHLDWHISRVRACS